MGVVICNFVASWKSKDGKIKRKDVRELIRMYENQEKHDKKIHDMAIDRFAENLKLRFGCFGYIDEIPVEEIDTLAVLMKEGCENE